MPNHTQQEIEALAERLYVSRPYGACGQETDAHGNTYFLGFSWVGAVLAAREMLKEREEWRSDQARELAKAARILPEGAEEKYGIPTLEGLNKGISPERASEETYKPPKPKPYPFIRDGLLYGESRDAINRHFDNLYHAINTILGSLDCVGLPSDPKTDKKESTLFALDGPQAGNWIRKNWKTGEEFVDGESFNEAELAQFNRIADREFARLRARSAAQVQAEEAARCGEASAWSKCEKATSPAQERKELIKQWAGDQRPIIVGQVWQSMSGRLIHIDRATALGIAYHETAFWGRTAQKQATIEEFRTRIKNEGLTLVTEAPQISAIIDGPSLTQERAMELIDQLYQLYPVLRPAPPQEPVLPKGRTKLLELRLRCDHALGLCGAVRDKEDRVQHLLLRSFAPAHPIVSNEEYDRLRALAADIQEKEVKDGS